LNWHGHPQAQLQFANSAPLISQLITIASLEHEDEIGRRPLDHSRSSISIVAVKEVEPRDTDNASQFERDRKAITDRIMSAK
jgi:hypothetical protein